MNSTVIALAGYIAWMLLLLTGIAGIRVLATLRDKRPANSFQPDGKDVSPLSARLCRAHANCYESFPVVGGLLLLALATNNTAITSSMALVVLGCRIAQSTTHVLSTSVLAVQLRFAFFLVQYGISICWAYQLLVKYAS